MQFEDPDGEQLKTIRNLYYQEIMWLRDNLKQAKNRQKEACPYSIAISGNLFP